MRIVATVLLGASMAVSAAGCAGSQQQANSALVAPLDTGPLDSDDAKKLAQAIREMDAGDLESAMAVLEELRQRKPGKWVVLHELALAEREAKRPNKAVDLLWAYRNVLPVQTLASLGSALDESRKPADAEKLFRGAIERFPKSGLLYSDLATTLRSNGKLDEAFALYRKGIEVEPALPANYVNLAVMLSDSDARGLTLYYGETFRLLEPDTERSRQVAQLMVQVCKDSVEIEEPRGNDLKVHVKLAPSVTIEKNEEVPKLPLANVIELAFGPGLVLAHRDGLSLETLHEARSAFMKTVRKGGAVYAWNRFPLFRWLKVLEAAGHLEAYDHWLFGPGFPDEYSSWARAHAQQEDAFARYMGENPLFR